MDEVTLRDYFAAKAMQALLRNEPLDYNEGSYQDVQEHINYVTSEAYSIADAMLAVRTLKLRNN